MILFYFIAPAFANELRNEKSKKITNQPRSSSVETTDAPEFAEIEAKIHEIMRKAFDEDKPELLDALDELYKERNNMLGAPYNENHFPEVTEDYCWVVTP